MYSSLIITHLMINFFFDKISIIWATSDAGICSWIKASLSCSRDSILLHNSLLASLVIANIGWVRNFVTSNIIRSPAKKLIIYNWKQFNKSPSTILWIIFRNNFRFSVFCKKNLTKLTGISDDYYWISCQLFS